MASSYPDINENKRRYPRLRLASDTEGGVELAGRQHVGQLLNVNCCGFSLGLSDHEGVSCGVQALGEIWLDGRMYQGEGRIAHVRPAGGGWAMGFSFARENRSLKDALLACLEAGKVAGAVQLTGRQGDSLSAAVTGFLSTKVAHDLFSLLRLGSLRHLDLRECRAMTSGGLGLLMIVLDKGVRLVNCAETIRPLMQTANICERCRNGAC